MSSRPRYLIVGASGTLGASLRRTLGENASIATYCRTPIPGGIYFDVLTMSLSAVLGEAGPVAHAFLFHGTTNIDACARDPDGSHQLNVESTCRLIDQLAERGIMPVFASSDAVFQGSRGVCTEDDAPDPILTYGRQKLEVEQHLSRRGGKWLVVRLAKVVGTRVRGDMLEEWMESLDSGHSIRCAYDQVLSPVHIDDVAQSLVGLAAGSHTGLFHLAGPNVLTRWELLQMLIEEVRRYRHCAPSLVSCSLREFDFAEPRPLDSSMSGVKLETALHRRCMSMEDACKRAASGRYRSAGGRNAGKDTSVGRSEQ